MKSYKGIVIVSLKNCGTTELLMHIAQCWRACTIKNEQEQELTLVIYFNAVVYPYYYHIISFTIKHNGIESNIHKEFFSLPHRI